MAPSPTCRYNSPMKLTRGRREFFEGELARARRARREGRLDEAFACLERAHVIGQYWIGPHLLSHWEMLRVGLLRLDGREIFGQLLRLALVVPGTWLGRLPDGNTGGANVNAFRKMPVDPELARLLAERE